MDEGRGRRVQRRGKKDSGLEGFAILGGLRLRGGRKAFARFVDHLWYW